MMVALRTFFVIVACVFLADEVSSFGLGIADDIVIETQKPDGLLYCDTMICKKGAVKCHVTKQNDPDDFRIIIRERKCLGPDGEVLQQEKIKETNTSKSTVNVDIISTGAPSQFGRELSPEEKKKLEQAQEKIFSQVGSTLSQVYSSLFNGTFTSRFPSFLGGNIFDLFKF